MKKLILWNNNIPKKMFDCFETFSNFIFENEVEVDIGNITNISEH